MLNSGSTGPYHDVMDLLDNMKTQLIKEQAAQHAIYDAQMQDCTAETTLRLGEMEEANSASTAAQDSLDACSAS